MTGLTLAVFVLTYVLIASRRLHLLPVGRPAGALLGAVLMVAVGSLTPREAYAAIDHDTLVLLFGMMMVTAYLDLAGFFPWLAERVARSTSSPRVFLVALSLVSGVLAALLVNDAVCLFLTPVVVVFCRGMGLPMGPFLIALATSTSIGAAATSVGNPQNMIIAVRSGMSFLRFLTLAGPSALVSLVVNAALLLVFYDRLLPATFADVPDETPEEEAQNVDLGRIRFLGLVGLCVLGGFLAGGNLGFTVLAGVALIIVLDRREPHDALVRVDWSILVFFSSLFIVIGAVGRTGLVDRVWAAAAPHVDVATPSGLLAFSLLVLVGSNLVSNVPLVLLVSPYLSGPGGSELGWVALSFVSTMAGNMTLVGAVANIIVAEGAKKYYTLGFWEYARFGVVSTLACLAAGLPVMWWTARLLAGA